MSERVAGDNLGDLDDTSLTFTLIGGGITYYLPSNLYLTGTAGLSRASFEFAGDEYDALNGIGFIGDVGYEWPMSDEWGLGVAGRLELHSVRGFYERQTAYDTGYRLSLEIHGPEFGAQLARDWRARILAFIDVGRGKDQAPARLEADGLSSIGLGGRLSRGKRLSMRFDTAVITNGAAGREKGELRTHYGVAYLF